MGIVIYSSGLLFWADSFFQAEFFLGSISYHIY